MAGKMTRKSDRKSAGKNGAKGAKKDALSRQKRCDLVFPVGRCHRLIKQGRYADNVGLGAAIFMAAVLEYLSSEVLELSGEMMKKAGKKTLVPRHIQMAIRDDEELNKLMAET